MGCQGSKTANASKPEKQQASAGATLLQEPLQVKQAVVASEVEASVEEVPIAEAPSSGAFVAEAPNAEGPVAEQGEPGICLREPQGAHLLGQESGEPGICLRESNQPAPGAEAANAELLAAEESVREPQGPIAPGSPLRAPQGAPVALGPARHTVQPTRDSKQVEATLPHEKQVEAPASAQKSAVPKALDKIVLKVDDVEHSWGEDQTVAAVDMRIVNAPPLEDVDKNADGGLSLKRWLQDTLPIGPDAKIANIKGYGSGLPDKNYHGDALSQLNGFQVVVFDGDWLKDGSFTSLVPPFLAEDTSRIGVAFRKAEGNVDGFMKSWIDCPQLSQMVLVLVPASYVSEATSELRTLGVSEDQLQNTALGWVTLRFSGSSHAVAVGGGQTTVNEANACLLLKPSDRRVSWSVLNVTRVTKTGEESPTELFDIAPQLSEHWLNETKEVVLTAPEDSCTQRVCRVCC